jgi:uncharacterized protein involved in exopolysaccharide biosynthesis
VQLINLALRHHRVVIGTGLVAAFLVGGWSLLQSRTYTSRASFVPRDATRDRTGVIGIAASLGISVGSNAPAESPQFYADLVTTDEIFLRAIAPRTSDSAGRDTVSLAKLLDVATADDRQRRVEMLKQLRDMVTVTANARTGVVTLLVTSLSPELSRRVADALVTSVNTFNLDMRKAGATGEREFVAERLETYQAELLAAEQAYRMFLIANRQASSPELTLENGRYLRRIANLQQIVTTLFQVSEQARIDERRDTPVIRVIETPRLPDEPNARGTVRKALFAGLAGVLMGLALVLVLERWRHALAHQDPDLTELVGYGRRLVPRWRR